MSSSQVRPGSAILASLFAFVLFGSAIAEIPELISYQGKVTDSGGTPVADGTYAMRFRIYDAVTGGAMEWDSLNRSIAVSDGVFNVLLGESPQPTLNLPFDEDYWLLVRFEGVDQSPRQRLTSAGYAYMASGLVPGTLIEGSVGSSTSGAVKAVNTSSSGTRYGGYFESESPSGKGVYAEAPHTGVYGRATATTGAAYGGSFASNSQDGKGIHAQAPHTGVYGKATATIGAAYGGSFASNSQDGKGIHAEAPHTGVYGKATATTGVVYGGYFESPSNQASGIRAFATSTTGDHATYGVYGRSSASCDGSIGVFGWSSYNSNLGGTYGVYGRSDGRNATSAEPYPVGVYGLASNTSGNGVGGYFQSNAVNGVGVEGQGKNVGVRGLATATFGTNYGLSASATSGWAGWFAGNVNVTGTLTKGSGSFLIDHPLDPENKLLRHNFVESPENLLIYRGTVKLGSDGMALVEMPEYFEALTKEKEASVHLTPEGKPFLTGYRWGADHTAFTAYGDPNREVAWMVMADRDDPVMHQLARPVEEDKGPDNNVCDRGELLYPTAYGYPKTAGRDYKIFTPANVHPVEEPEDWRTTAAGASIEPDRTSGDVDVMEVGDAR